MPDSKAERALRRADDLFTGQRLWLPAWQELSDFIQPRKANIQVQRSPGQSLTDRLFDSTAIHANELLAASMQGALTSDAFRWFGLRLRGVELEKDHQVAVDLEWCAQDMYDALAESNFQAETHEVYLDLPCFGTAAVFVEERTPRVGVAPGALRFTALPPGSFAIDEDEEGRVDTVFRKFKLSARAAAAAYGVSPGPGQPGVGKQVEAALQKNPAQRFEFLHAVYPREDWMPNSRTRLPAKKFPIASMYVDVEGRTVAHESGYNEPPIMVPRWTKSSGEVYGRGPGDVALPDIKTLNKAVELKLKAWAKVVEPPLMARDEGVITKPPDLRNGGLTYVRDMEAIKPLHELGGRLDVASMEEEKTRQAIRRMFFSDQLQLQEGPQMTAYEVQVRYELMQRILGPTLGRTNVEFLNPMVARVFWIRLRASGKDSAYRRIEAWCRANNVALDIEYEGPLAKAQRLQESVALQRFFQIILPLSQIKPEIADNLDLDAVTRVHATSVGVPERTIRPVDQVSEIRQARQQAQEQQNALDNAAVAAKAGGDIAPLVQALGQQKEGTIPVGTGSPALGSG